MKKMNWNEINTVLLDMDGTLLDLHYDTHFWREYLPQRYAFSRGLDVDTAKQVLNPIFEKHAGTLNWYCLDFWSRELGVDVAEMKRDVAHLIAIKEGALEFLDQLKKMGKRTVLVTNAHPDSLALKLEHTRLDNHLDRIISAHELGLPKESALFWGALQEIEPYTPHLTLLVDDNLHALRSASDFGIKHLLAACHPDSQQPARHTDEFPAFHHFNEIMP
jgi:putative hydrolase of the HAD superfamily